MSVYLKDIPLDLAWKRFQDALETAGLWGILGIEEVVVDEGALGRVLAEPVWADFSSPHYHASAMDGFAVRADDTTGALPSSPRVLLTGDVARYVDTGDPLPEWANAVIPIEEVETLGARGEVVSGLRQAEAVRIRAAVTPWSHVRPMGEDIVATQLVLPAGQVLRPVDLGALIACGKSRVKVSRRARVAVLPTGTELVPAGTPAKPGEIIEYNSVVLAAQIEAWGGTPERFEITPDNFEQIRARVREAALRSDLVLLNAGSSAGAEDFSAGVIASLGEVLVHGVAVRPGHPVILGMLRVEGKDQPIPVVGVPGYPVSAALTGEIFIEPLLALWQGKAVKTPQQLDALLTRKVTSPAGDDDYMRVAVGRVGQRLLAAPLSRGAGIITSLIRADGIVVIPRGTQGLEAGAQVCVRLYRSPEEIEHTIFVIGSHDLTLDLVSQHLSVKNRRLVSVNVGSQGGLVALRRGETHLAGTHLLDPQTGEYNLSSIRQYLPGMPVRVIRWVGREQGLLVKSGNPKGIQSLVDLARADVRFVNRQRGAGTRVLLDYHLSKLGLNPDTISGYGLEEYTHLSVAAAVSSGRADTGLGIAAAAQALGLDFIPLYAEQYDLVFPRSYLEEPLLAPLFELAQDVHFRQAVAALPGYTVSEMGNVVADLG